MIDTARGSQTCFICGTPMTWVTNIFGGLVVAHGSEMPAESRVTKGQDQNRTVELGIQLECPNCHAINQFSHRHTL